MSVKKLLEQKAEIRKSEKDKAQRAAQQEADARRKTFAKAIVQVCSDLEGLDFERVGDGDFRVNYRDFHRNITVWVRVEGRFEADLYDDRSTEKEWCLRVGISSRALNVPDTICSVEGFAETFSDYLLRLS